MVVKVWGSVGGIEVIFSHVEGDNWSCVIPEIPDGEYVVDLYAIDECGNIGYYATVIFIIDQKHLKFEVKMLGYKTELQESKYGSSVYFTDYGIRVAKCVICGGDLS